MSSDRERTPGNQTLVWVRCNNCGWKGRRRTYGLYPCGVCGSAVEHFKARPKATRHRPPGFDADRCDDLLGRLQQAQDDLDATLAERDELIVDALKAGATRAEVATVTGLSISGVGYRLQTARKGSKYLSPKAAS